MAPSSRYLEKECPPILEMTSEKCVTAFAERTAITSGRARRAPNRMAAGQCCSATLLPHSRRSVRGSTPRWSPPLCSTASLPNLESTRRTWSGPARRCRTVRAEWKPQSQEVTWISPAQASALGGEPAHSVLRNRENAARKSLPGTLIAGKVNQPPGRSPLHGRQALHKRILGREHLRRVDQVEPLHIGQ
jgi:hypothetical protein